MIQTYYPSDIKKFENKLAFFRHLADQYERNIVRQINKESGQPLPISGGAPTLPVCLSTLRGGSVTVNTFTAAATIIAAEAQGPFSTDYFKTLGASWRQEASGIIGTTGTPTFALGTYFGTAIGSITTMLCITPTITTASGLSNINWYWRAVGVTKAISGTTATMLVTGILFGDIEALAATVAGEPVQYAVNATPPTAVVTDLSTSVYLDLKGTWGTSNVANSTTVNDYSLISYYS